MSLAAHLRAFASRRRVVREETGQVLVIVALGFTVYSLPLR